MADQPLSYQLLPIKKKVFVLEFLRSGCNAFITMKNLNPNDSDQTNSARASRMMSDEGVQAAISDKLDQRLVKHDTSREAMTARLFDLIADVANLPESKQRISHLKFILDVYGQIAKISGLNQTKHTHDHNHRSIVVNINDVDHEGNVIEGKAESVDCARLEEGDPGQLAISFPSVHAVPYTLEELLSDDLPDDMGNPDNSSEEDPV